ncbi:ABC transporter permease [Tengunoibacter tsumagoiensis]|uniref:ABC-2 type transporter transmembrane domain-containing protein n=1 Tax=Tengunoibacter tsumagoiensis TaxID=2014871 RepID=A0A402A792_9CHLR|nr:ABC transporter permease [Tengunoibacter tsumagoiensis]GCE14861.1 hypothetical protein KTT_47200 [Tengunoibacter tsumagoiensis]
MPLSNHVAHNSPFPAGTKRKIRFTLPLIIKREYLAQVQQHNFQMITFLLVLVVIITAFIPTILTTITARTQTQIVIINTAGKIGNFDGHTLLSFLNANLNVGDDSSQQVIAKSSQKAHFALRMASATEIDIFRQQVRDNELSILLQIARNTSGDLQFIYYTNKSLTHNMDLSQVQTVAAQLHIQDKLSQIGVEPAQTDSLFTPPVFEATSSLLEQNTWSPLENDSAIIVTMLTTVLLFLFIQQYCNMVAAGVGEEKCSRIIEILINATTPFQLLLGKIIGVGLVGVSQMSLIYVAGSVTLLIQPPLQRALHIEANSTLPEMTALSFNMLGLLVLYFVLGFLLYAALYAAAGALVSSQAEVASTARPLSFFIMASYLVSFYATFTPDANWIVPLSYVPFFTPMMMLVREAAVPLPWWEIALSSLFMLAALLGLTWFAASIYRSGVLMYGQKSGAGAFFRYLCTARNATRGKYGVAQIIVDKNE